MRLFKRVSILAVISVLSLSYGIPEQNPATLKSVFQKDFLVGAALSGSRIRGRDSLAVTIAVATSS